MQKKSKFIVIEGLDGSGKSTQIELLKAYLKGEGIETKFVHFPRHHEGIFGELISKFLRGEFGNVADVHPQLVALLFAEDRKDFSRTITQWLDEGYFVLADRYVLSNIAFQCAKTKDPDEKAALRKWINNFEYNYNQIPKPDLSVYLEVPFSFTQQSLSQRRAGEARDYLNGKDDIHEKDLSLQLAVKEEYETIVTSDPTVNRVVCYDSGNNMRSKTDIHNQIVDSINQTVDLSAI